MRVTSGSEGSRHRLKQRLSFKLLSNLHDVVEDIHLAMQHFRHEHDTKVAKDAISAPTNLKNSEEFAYIRRQVSHVCLKMLKHQLHLANSDE